MVKKTEQDSDPKALRQKAEKQKRSKSATLHLPRTAEDMHRLVHELEVHHIELEMQNAELRQAREELELSRDKYTELFEFAPIAYFTMYASGVIRKVNIAGAQMLGMDKQSIVDKPLSLFIADAAEREIFSNHLTLVMQRRVMLRCEASLKTNDSVILGQFQSIAVAIDDTPPISLPPSSMSRSGHSWKMH
jgi:PAS domain-containing protein